MVASRIPVLALCLVSLLAHAQAGGDLQAQILYAYHGEDANRLASIVQTLNTQEQGGGVDDTLRYHLAHASYRLGLLGGRGAPSAFADCVDQLKGILQSHPESVEALALTSACYANLAHLERLTAVLDRRHAVETLAAATALAPRNPRVLLIEAQQGFDRAKPGSPDQARAFAELERSVQIFEQTSGTREDVPGWGHAEAYLEYGRRLQARGDFLGARNWLEKSLLAAPDFKAAQRQLATLLQHP